MSSSSAPSPSSAMSDLQPPPPPRSMSSSSPPSPSSAMSESDYLLRPLPPIAFTSMSSESGYLLRTPPPFPFTSMSSSSPDLQYYQLRPPPPFPFPSTPGLPSLLKLLPPPQLVSRLSERTPSTVPGLPFPSHCPEILLDQNCCIGYCQDSPTSVKTENSQGLLVEVSFKICNPPALSQCFVRCYDLTGRQRLAVEPLILGGASGGLALLTIPFSGDGIHHMRYMDYFIYRAGPGTPSLHLLPKPYPPDYRQNMVAVLPICDEHYAVVFPVLERFILENRYHYTMHIYRSHRKAWCTHVALIAKDIETQEAKIKMLLHEPTSVVYAGTGLIGWVDLWSGVLICNVLDKKPTVRFVSLPVPEPCETLKEFGLDFQDLSPRLFRHLTINNGLIKFIDLKFHRDDEGWMATTWTRPISSDVWHEGLTFDTSDLSVTDSSFLHLLPEILDEEKKLTWEKLMSGGPTLSLNQDHIVYILVKMSWAYPTAFVLTVNTRSLTIESCAQCSGEKMLWLYPTHVSSDLSSYFDMATSAAPGEKMTGFEQAHVPDALSSCCDMATWAAPTWAD